ncbi:hypothetical protein [Mesorhizobium sp. M0977]|uniref:hypothetical protein n=1 Tax=Mesorhizobium sp. M0977 TaxID=2957039 RepID=UPI003339E7E8
MKAASGCRSVVIVPHELELGDLSRRQGAARRAARRGFITVDLPRPRERSESRFVRYREGRDCASSACIEQAVNSPAFVGWQGRKLKGHQNGIDLQSVFTIRFYLSRGGKVLSTAIKACSRQWSGLFCVTWETAPTMPSTGRRSARLCGL